MQHYFSYIVAVIVNGGGNRSTSRKQHNSKKICYAKYYPSTYLSIGLENNSAQWLCIWVWILYGENSAKLKVKRNNRKTDEATLTITQITCDIICSGRVSIFWSTDGTVGYTVLKVRHEHLVYAGNFILFFQQLTSGYIIS